MKKWLIILFMAFSLSAFGQEKIEINENDYQNSTVEMADVMRSEGKIYVLVGIIGIVFAGLLVYVINTDRKVTRLEKQLKEE
ncbi:MULTISPECIES: CcmD family protein [Cyclobacteriaceae]|uniref:CcmD family protein n=1 Tax=Aquiflexum gelatinilyticum TaxID=2961943 RepID=A0A9X2SYE2_9BACT|nr:MULTISPECIES: CcmD family protein [Cyclobacteriaceae]MCH6232592.1 CcmD family protein [Cognataquiflexum rubidum]MCR9015019.1 CcmD family protein [Aquiflexum gelatinilyticum]MCS4434047.1 CcmD family protein [Aquiflexum gelatinilyticum]